MLPQLRNPLAIWAAVAVTVGGTLTLYQRQSLPSANYQLNTILALHIYVVVVACTAAAFVSAWENSLSRRQPGLSQVEASSQRSKWTIMTARTTAVLFWFLVSYIGLALLALAFGDRGTFRSGDLLLHLLNVAWMTLAVAWGALLGVRVPVLAAPLVASASNYAVYFFVVTNYDSAVAHRLPVIDAAWAPYHSTSPLRLSSALLAVLLLAASLIAVAAKGRWGAGAFLTLFGVVCAALALQPAPANTQFYAQPNTSTCWSADPWQLCLLSDDADLRPSLEISARKAQGVLDGSVKEPLTVTEQTLPGVGTQVFVSPEQLLVGQDVTTAGILDGVVRAQVTCANPPLTPAGIFWTDVIVEALQQRAGVANPANRASTEAEQLRILSISEFNAWVRQAIAGLKSCNTPAEIPARS